MMTNKFKLNVSEKVAFTALVISIVSLFLNLYFSNEANKRAMEANTIAQNAKDISQDNNNFAKIARSQELADTNYDRLYDNGINQKIMQAVKNSQNIGSLFQEEEIKQYIDIFEGLGAYYCQGDVYKKNLVNSFYNSMKYYCDDEYIYQNYKGKKNGSATLCTELFPKSKFASTLDTTNLASCTFTDSTVFPNSSSESRSSRRIR